MEIGDVVVWVTCGVILVWLAMVFAATWRQIEGEAERAGVIRSLRPKRRDPRPPSPPDAPRER